MGDIIKFDFNKGEVIKDENTEKAGAGHEKGLSDQQMTMAGVRMIMSFMKSGMYRASHETRLLREEWVRGMTKEEVYSLLASVDEEKLMKDPSYYIALYQKFWQF